MKIVEQRVTNGERDIFELEEFLSRPLFAHLATTSEQGPRDSPVWFHWDGACIWIIGGESFPDNIRRDPRCAVGIVDFDRTTGLVQHVGLRGTGVVVPFDTEIAESIFGKYMGSDQAQWDLRFEPVWNGESKYPLVRFTPETAVVRDQSYHVGLDSTS